MELIIIVLFFTASFLLSLVLTKLVMHISPSLGLMGRDAHKPAPALVSRIGGLGFVVSFMILSAIAAVIMGAGNLIVFIAAVFISSLIGLSEDIRELHPLLKPLLLVLPAIPIIALGLYDPRPFIPFVGKVRLTILYPILILLAYSVVSNAINSIDVLNGAMVLMSIPPLALLGTLSFISGQTYPALASFIMIGALLGFLRYNWLPARVFSGNIGSVVVGTVIATIAITARLEIVAMIALIPHIMNEFYLLASVGGLKSGKVIGIRPVVVEDGLIAANPDPKAPLTLVRLITAGRALREKRIVSYMGILSIYSSLLAAITFLMGG